MRVYSIEILLRWEAWTVSKLHNCIWRKDIFLLPNLIRFIFDIKEDGQLVSDALLHRLLQSRDLLSAVSVPAGWGSFFFLLMQTRFRYTTEQHNRHTPGLVWPLI